MGSSVGIAVLLVGAILTRSGTVRPGTAPITTSLVSPRATSPMRTTVEEPGGIKRNSTSAVQSEWALGCVAILTAPKSMQVGDTANVETTLLVAAGQAEIANLLRDAKDTADAINAGASAKATDPATGLDNNSHGALQRMVEGNKNRQAAVDTLPGSPIMIVHLSGANFKITPDTPERQAVTAKTPAIWGWTIKAVDPGATTLTVSYSAEVELAGQRVPQTLRELKRDVIIDVAPPASLLKQIADQSSSAKTIAENASWFWTTLIFPALMFLYGLRKWFSERHA